MTQSPKVLIAIEKAIKNKKISKKFKIVDIRKACPGFARRTYSSYLAKHRKGNPCGHVAYFKRNTDGTYSIL